VWGGFAIAAGVTVFCGKIDGGYRSKKPFGTQVNHFIEWGGLAIAAGATLFCGKIDGHKPQFQLLG